MHRRLEVEALLARSVRMIQEGKTAAYHQRLWAAAIASIEHCAR